MSLAIEVSAVAEVLLADGWHSVKDQSFYLDSYEFVDGDFCLHGGGDSSVCATGFSLRCDDGRSLSGPLTAILAVREAQG